MQRKSFLDYFGEGLAEFEKIIRPVTEPARQFLEGIGLVEAKPQTDTTSNAVAQKPATPPSTLDDGNGGSPHQKEIDLLKLFGVHHDGKGNTPPPPPPPPGASGAVAVAPAQVKELKLPN
jgi:hypothetical protein